MFKLVINADDFGFGANANAAIIACLERNFISTATIMTNMPGFDEAVHLAHEYGFADRIGLHLNFTQGIPLTDEIKKCPMICDANGFFNAKWHRSKMCRLWLPTDARRAMAKEVVAQMARYLASRFPLLHMDSHHHSHTDPTLARIACPLAKSNGFRSIRISRNAYELGRSGVGIGKKIYKRYVNSFIKKYASAHTNFFGGAGDLLPVWDAIPDDSSVELMTHPQLWKNGAPDLTGEIYDFHSPMKQLQDFLRLHSQSYKLVTFRGLEA